MSAIQLPESLKKQLASGDVIPLIGAGVSMSVKTKAGKNAFPSWPELLKKAASKLKEENLEQFSKMVDLQVDNYMYQEAAQVAKKQLVGRGWFDFLNEQFSIDFTELDDSCKALPEAIWKLSNRVVTLNYDKVLEWAHEEAANLCVFDNSNNSQLTEFTRSSNKEMLWHLHGKIEQPENMVLTPQSYHRLYEDKAEEHYQAALKKLSEIISNKTLLFIGCSLDDAELLAEIAKQNKLFGGNTGPHYALIRECDKKEIDIKLAENEVKTLSFSDFGQPLIDAVKKLVECKNQQVPQNKIEPIKEVNEELKQPDKISLFTASPLDKPIDDSGIIAKFKKFKYPIYQQAFTESNLMAADDYSILFLLAKNTSNGLLIEDGNACSDYLAIKGLTENLPLNAKLTILITDKLLSEEELAQVDFPLLVLPLLDKSFTDLKVLDKLTHQLFKKPDVKHFIDNTKIQAVQMNNELLASLNPENSQYWSCYHPELPREINSSELQSFTGRLSDLADISQKLTKAASNQRLLTIKGSGGLGKTTIAKKVALELANRGLFDAGVYFIDCENITSTNQLELHIGEAFNLRTADDLFKHLAKYHDQRSRLLIFDNLESLLFLKQADKTQNKKAIQQVKELLSRTLIYASVLVTSRESINADWEEVLPFRQMESEEALALFNRLTKNSYSSDEEQEFARRKILEPQLNNNPLAIKLICDGIPKGKRLKELKQELEEDFFGKVKEEELTLMFDDEIDANINRQESLYISILYSYKTLSESQRRTFESFSLFPDGIDLNTFKRLVTESKKTDRNQDTNKFKKTISDKDISVLANKSLVEDYNGFYTLQSVIQRFARFQFEQHTLEKDKQELFRQAVIYNQEIMGFISALKNINERKSILIFLSLFKNLLAAISYGVKKNVVRNEDELKYYLFMVDDISSLSKMLSLAPDLLVVLEGTNIECLTTKENIKQVCLAWRMIKVNVMYYNGDFDIAFNQLKDLVSKETNFNAYRQIKKRDVETITQKNVRDIYLMEGEALCEIIHIIKYNKYRFVELMNGVIETGRDVKPLLSLVKPDSNYFEAESYLNDGINLEQINKIINELHESEHLKRVGLTYIKSREVYISYESIDKLVNVNPYSRGLKNLMYAFSYENNLQVEDSGIDESNKELNDKIIAYYQSALPDLSHIKFYYVQAIYFYVQFLKKINHREFDTIYDQGLELTINYHYRYWQHRFLLLKNSTLGTYKPENYPLPGNPEISPLIEKQVRWIHKEYGTSLNPFNNAELKVLPN